MFDVTASRRRCLGYRRRILELSQSQAALHMAPAFSCLEIVDTIYFGLMRHDGATPDTFILSKGHGALAQYLVLEARGLFTKEEIDGYCRPGSPIGMHPDYGLPGVEASTGSLGHGLGIAMGMALADKVARADRRVFVVMSDGELQEGSVWESMMIAPSLGLKNLIACVDLNDIQSFDRTSKTHPNFYPVLDKVRAFGWETVDVDGHDAGQIYNALQGRTGDRPFMLIGNTIKGKGVSFMENVPMWHYRSPSPAEFEQAMAELALVEA